MDKNKNNESPTDTNVEDQSKSDFDQEDNLYESGRKGGQSGYSEQTEAENSAEADNQENNI